jgi:hypothetical protein
LGSKREVVMIDAASLGAPGGGMIQIMRVDSRQSTVDSRESVGRAGGAFELDPVVLGEGLPDDPLEVSDPAGGQGALPIGQLTLAEAQDLPPQQVHRSPPAGVEQVGRGVERLRHDGRILPQIAVPRS